MHKLDLPCLTQKVELNCIIPAIRNLLIEFLEKEGIKDTEFARKLNITRAAVSQYKHKKRGKKINFPEKIKQEIQKSALAIKKGKNSNVEIIKIINLIKKNRFICVICKACECK